MKRRETEREIEEREDAEMRRKKGETDQLYNLYQQEKDKQRHQNAHKLSDMHLKQAVSASLPLSAPIRHTLIYSLSLSISSKNEKIENVD